MPGDEPDSDQEKLICNGRFITPLIDTQWDCAKMQKGKRSVKCAQERDALRLEEL
jgi:hypothetical protein